MPDVALLRAPRLAIAPMAAVLLCVACGAEAPQAPTTHPPGALPGIPADHPPMSMADLPVPPRVAPETVMAQVDGESVTAGDVDAALEQAPGEVRYEYTAPGPVTELVQSLVDRKLMAAAARQAGLPGEPGSKEAGPPAEYLLAEAWLERELSKLPSPTEADISRYYREHQEDFTEPQRVLVTRVVTRTGAAADRARSALTMGVMPDELKADLSTDLLSVDQVWLQDAPGSPPLTVIALGLDPGSVSKVQSTDDRFVVLRAEEKRARKLRGLAEVRAGILATLSARAREDATASAVARLRQNVRVTLNQDAIDSYSGANAPRSP